MVLTGQLPQVLAELGWQPIETAPVGELLRLLVVGGDFRLEDEIEEVPTPTIGQLNDDGTWYLAGWCWTHDHFVSEPTAQPVGWKHFEDEPMELFLHRLRVAEASPVEQK